MITVGKKLICRVTRKTVQVVVVVVVVQNTEFDQEDFSSHFHSIRSCLLLSERDSLEVSSVVLLISSDASSELHVLPHESHSVGVDGAEVAVFEETSEIALRGLLKSVKTLRREADIRIGGAGYLSDESLEG